MTEDVVRIMECPFCGHTCESRGIGAVHCGPHRLAFTPHYWPAVRMIEKVLT